MRPDKITVKSVDDVVLILSKIVPGKYVTYNVDEKEKCLNIIFMTSKKSIMAFPFSEIEKKYGLKL